MAMTLLTTNTSSNAASSSFTSKIDGTYKLYIFKFYDVNPVTDDASFTFQVNATDGADYNDSAITSTYWVVYHRENDATATFGYHDSFDQAQGTAFQPLSQKIGNGGDESGVGELHLFNPSSTTYVKHFYSTMSSLPGGDWGAYNNFCAGYINDTTAIDDIQFKMSSGNMDAVIKMYGVK